MYLIEGHRVVWCRVWEKSVHELSSRRPKLNIRPRYSDYRSVMLPNWNINSWVRASNNGIIHNHLSHVASLNIRRDYKECRLCPLINAKLGRGHSQIFLFVLVLEYVNRYVYNFLIHSENYSEFFNSSLKKVYIIFE